MMFKGFEEPEAWEFDLINGSIETYHGVAMFEHLDGLVWMFDTDNEVIGAVAVSQMVYLRKKDPENVSSSPKP